jgi:hypothetical protein
MANKAGQILSSRLAAAVIASLFAATGLEHVQAKPAVPTVNVLYSFQGGMMALPRLAVLFLIRAVRRSIRLGHSIELTRATKR